MRLTSKVVELGAGSVCQDMSTRLLRRNLPMLDPHIRKACRLYTETLETKLQVMRSGLLIQLGPICFELRGVSLEAYVAD